MEPEEDVLHTVSAEEQEAMIQAMRDVAPPVPVAAQMEAEGFAGASAHYIATLSSIVSSPIKVAITGESGSGKSSLVNGLRDMSDVAEGAAPTDEEECTMEPTMYADPRFPSVQYWDLPGCGTPRWPVATYADDVELHRFDVLVIVTSVRVRENDLLLLAKARALGVPTLLLRSKIDVVSEQQLLHCLR
jgi:interferon gamma inducible protein 47